MSIQVFYPFFNWVICVLTIELYELLIYFDINPLSDIMFANIFSYSIDHIFTLDYLIRCAETF